jgi:hypothetical protein
MLRGVDLFLKLELDHLEQRWACAEERALAVPRADLLEAEALVGGHSLVEMLDDLDEALREGGVELLHTIRILAVSLA